jgi:hypothetical protein
MAAAPEHAASVVAAVAARAGLDAAQRLTALELHAAAVGRGLQPGSEGLTPGFTERPAALLAAAAALGALPRPRPPGAAAAVAAAAAEVATLEAPPAELEAAADALADETAAALAEGGAASVGVPALLAELHARVSAGDPGAPLRALPLLEASRALLEARCCAPGAGGARGLREGGALAAGAALAAAYCLVAPPGAAAAGGPLLAAWLRDLTGWPTAVLERGAEDLLRMALAA